MEYYGNNDWRDYIAHHGIKGQKWGVKNGPPYPLDSKISTGKRLKTNDQDLLLSAGFKKDNYTKYYEKHSNGVEFWVNDFKNHGASEDIMSTINDIETNLDKYIDQVTKRASKELADDLVRWGDISEDQRKASEANLKKAMTNTLYRINLSTSLPKNVTFDFDSLGELYVDGVPIYVDCSLDNKRLKINDIGYI